MGALLEGVVAMVGFATLLVGVRITLLVFLLPLAFIGDRAMDLVRFFRNPAYQLRTRVLLLVALLLALVLLFVMRVSSLRRPAAAAAAAASSEIYIVGDQTYTIVFNPHSPISVLAAGIKCCVVCLLCCALLVQATASVLLTYPVTVIVISLFLSALNQL